MRKPIEKRFDLAAAVRSVVEQPATELTVAELVRAHSAVSCDGSDRRLRKWVDAFGTTSAWQLTSERLQVAAQAMLEHGYSPAAVNRDLSSLGSAYKWAGAKRICPRGFRSPTLGVPRFDEPIRRVHVDPAKVEALRHASLAHPDRRFGVFVALLIDTGARKSEILERRGREVDCARGEVLAPNTKNGTPRVLFFRPETGQLIRRVFGKLAPDRLLFEGREPGQPICYRRAWDGLRLEVGLPELHIHDLRHVKAASLLRAGVTIGVAAQVLGHDPAVLSRRYGHLETEALRRAQEQAWRTMTN
ncbi:site-specific integrase [Caenimonas sedimenti]|uniref:Site-specific integrase n=1 Tax=Caenimonas sedimenti TaxID=2596921 RepID=A0A562ZGX1_9BURK|nr:site-specific integrase [Caenimonas sedimenti]TWO67763.1 site-specific integrase [Caenimonas sedimenti]